MKRTKVKRETDRRVFKRTAIKTKQINLPSTARRGGIRL